MEIELNKKKNRLKKIKLGAFLGVFIGLLFGISYAMFTYNNTGMNNKLIVGDIYMRYKETSAINLSGAMPSASYPTEASGNYFEFQIIGKNTNTTKDITYNVKLAYGDSIQGKDRLTDSHLVFKLVEVVNNEEQTPALVENQSFNTIPEAILYTATIPKNTNNETTRTFRVYARISEEVGIGTNTTYTIEQWNNKYASVKVNVDGGFVSEESQPQPTSAGCFTPEEDNIYLLNSPLSTAALNYCVDYFTNYHSYEEADAEDYCNGTNIPNSEFTFQQELYRYPDGQGTFNTEDIDNFLENGVISSENIISITDYDSTCGSDVVIPSMINSKNVKKIGSDAFNNKHLTSVYFPSSIKIISNFSFYDNNISDLTIPVTVERIGAAAFDENPINNLTLFKMYRFMEGDGYSVFGFANHANVYLNTSSLTGFESSDYSGPFSYDVSINVHISNNATTIGNNTFYQSCNVNLIIPNTITSIEPDAFNNASDFTLRFSNRSCSQIEDLENYEYWSNDVSNIYGTNDEVCK